MITTGPRTILAFGEDVIRQDLSLPATARKIPSQIAYTNTFTSTKDILISYSLCTGFFSLGNCYKRAVFREDTYRSAQVRSSLPKWHTHRHYFPFQQDFQYDTFIVSEMEMPRVPAQVTSHNMVSSERTCLVQLQQGCPRPSAIHNDIHSNCGHYSTQDWPNYHWDR